MFNIELLRAYCSGTGIKVAIIDTGVEFDTNVLHLHYDKESQGIIEGKSEIKSLHGSACAKKIVEVAPDIFIVDINVTDIISNEITEESVAAAIKYAVAEKVDIINISLGFLKYSFTVDKMCKFAFDNNVIIVSASAQSVYFPAYSKYSVKVSASFDSVEEKIELIKEGLFSVSCLPSYRRSVIDDLNSPIIESEGSSIACAYFSGILALYLESKPFVDRTQIKHRILGSVDQDINIIDSKDTNYFNEKIEENSVFTIMSTHYNFDIERYKPIINKNIIGFCDSTFKFINVLRSDIDKSKLAENLIVINPVYSSRMKYKTTGFKNVQYIGVFDNHDNCKPMLCKKKKIRDITTPLILIAGVGMECGKFIVQLELMNQMISLKYPSSCITYNPLGYLFDMEVFAYPLNISYPEIVYSINNVVSDIECNNSQDLEAIIINAAGGIFPINKVNTNDFGMLYHAYISSLPIDYVVLCTNTSMDWSELLRKIDELDNMEIKNIAIVMSDLTYDVSTLERLNNIITFPENKDVIKRYVEEYKYIFPQIKIFTLDDVKNGDLLRDITMSLS